MFRVSSDTRQGPEAEGRRSSIIVAEKKTPYKSDEAMQTLVDHTGFVIGSVSSLREVRVVQVIAWTTTQISLSSGPSHLLLFFWRLLSIPQERTVASELEWLSLARPFAARLRLYMLLEDTESQEGPNAVSGVLLLAIIISLVLFILETEHMFDLRSLCVRLQQSKKITQLIYSWDSS